MSFPLLTTLLLLPLAGALATALVRCRAPRFPHTVAAAASIGTLILAGGIYASYDAARGGVQFVERVPWIADLGVTWYLGVDGISLPLVLLVAILSTAAVFSSWNISVRAREFFVLLQILVAGVMGTFLAQDLFIFLLFYELVVIPIYIMIVVWGSSKRVTKEYAGMKLTLYLLAGSAFLLVGVVTLFVQSVNLNAVPDFSFTALAATGFSPGFQKVTFGLLLLGFGSLLSMWPFHSWSPDGYAGAPTAVSIIHAGVLKKIGGYGLIRIAICILPEGAAFWAPVMAALGIAGTVYAAFAAVNQKDLKYLIGYASVSHMGYVILAIAALNETALSAAVGYMFAHGIAAGLFFSTVGFIYERTRTRNFPELGGLAHQMPRVSVAFMLAGLASLGLPGLIVFAPEFMSFLGAYQTFGWVTVPAIGCVVLTALYVLRAAAIGLFGPRREEFDVLHDLRRAEMVPVIMLGAVMVIGGFFPSLLFNVVNAGMGLFNFLP